MTALYREKNSIGKAYKLRQCFVLMSRNVIMLSGVAAGVLPAHDFPKIKAALVYVQWCRRKESHMVVSPHESPWEDVV